MQYAHLATLQTLSNSVFIRGITNPSPYNTTSADCTPLPISCATSKCYIIKSLQVIMFCICDNFLRIFIGGKHKKIFDV